MKKLIIFFENLTERNTKFDVKAIFCLSLFLFCILKYQLINVHHIVPIHGSTHGIITFYIIIPCLLISLVFSILTIVLSFSDIRKNVFNLLMLLPLLMLVYYVFFR